MSEIQIDYFFKEIKVPYTIYGNFNFVEDKDDDIDVLIEGHNFNKVKKFLVENNISFHQRKYYPGQLFVTGTEIKIHVTKDLFIGGRRVAYLLKLFLINKIIKDSTQWNSYSIINFSDYVKYRMIKKFFNPKKELKTSEYPKEHRSDLKPHINPLKLIIFIFTTLIRNSVFILPRFLKKRIWVRL